MRYPMYKLLRMVRPWTGFLVIAAVMALLGAAAEQFVPLQVKRVVNEALQPSQHGLPMTAVAVLGCLLASGQLLKLAQRLCTEWAATRLRARLFEAGVHHILSRPMSWFQGEHSGALQVRIERAAGAVTDVVKLALAEVLPPFVGMLMAAALLLATNRSAGLAAIVCIPIMVILTLAQARSQQGIRAAINTSREEQGVGVSEAILGIEQVKLFRAEEIEARRVGQVARQLGDREMKHHFAMAGWDLGKFIAERAGFMVTLSLVLLGASATGPALDLGSVVAVVMLWDRVAEPIRHLHRILDELGERAVLARTYLELLDGDPVTRSGAQGHTNHRGDVVFDGVSFGYDACHPVLLDLTMDVSAGRKVALVGASGSGKTTVARLLAGLYKPCGGRVLVDDMDVPLIEAQGQTPTVGLLTQEVYCFCDTIRNNIAYGNDTASDDDIRRAARLAGLADYIEALPLGYETVLGQRGAGLSGGQRQRLSLARLILQDPDVVAFDEPVSALDPENTRRFFGTLLDVFRENTVFVITHNLSELSWADTVVVMEHGRVAEAGHPNELLEQPESLLRQLRDGAGCASSLVA